MPNSIDILQYLPSAESVNEIKESVNSVNTNVDFVKTGISSVNTNIDDVKNNIDTIKHLSNNIFDVVSNFDPSESNAAHLTTLILSGNSTYIVYALSQNYIGKALNNAYNLNSSELESCITISDIASNENALQAIATNSTAINTCSYDSSLLAALIPYISDAEFVLSKGYGYSKYNVNDIVYLNYGGNNIAFRVLAKDYLTQGKIVLAPTIVVASSKWSNSGYSRYNSSTIREYLNSTVFNSFSEKIKSAIVASPIQCYVDGSLVTCNDKLWLLSNTEVGFSEEYHIPNIGGSQFAFYNSDSSRIMKNSNGSPIRWWLRSITTSLSDVSMAVKTTGSRDSRYITESNGVVFAFEI